MKLVRVDAFTLAQVPDDDPRPAIGAPPAELPQAEQAAEPEAAPEAEPELPQAEQAVKRGRKP